MILLFISSLVACLISFLCVIIWAAVREGDREIELSKIDLDRAKWEYECRHRDEVLSEVRKMQTKPATPAVFDLSNKVGN